MEAERKGSTNLAARMDGGDSACREISQKTRAKKDISCMVKKLRILLCVIL